MHFGAFRPFIFTALFFGFCDSLWAQYDPLAAGLLRTPSSSKTPNHSEESGLASGRYKVKKAAPLKVLPKKQVEEISSEQAKEKQDSQLTTAVVLPVGSVTKKATVSAKSQPAKKTVEPKESELSQKIFGNKQPSATSGASFASNEPLSTTQPKNVSDAGQEIAEAPPVADQVKDLVLGNKPAEIEAYKEQIHPDDVRLNRMELEVSPGVVASHSKSSFSYRDFSSFSPKILLGANFWMTPFLGVYGKYSTSFGADIAGDSSSKDRIPVQHEWSELGFNIRHFYGMSRRSPSLTFGMQIYEYKFTVPGDSITRVNTKSTGLGLHLSTRVPFTPNYSWVIGGKIVPRIHHSETSTGFNLSSGSPGESSQFDFSLGGEFKLKRQNQIFWELNFALEKDQFSGQANMSDPNTGSAPRGVSVENTFTLFSFGYRWGQ